MELYGKQLQKPNTTIVECHSFDEYFDQQLKELEGSSAKGPDVPRRLEDEVQSGNIGDEPPLPPGLIFRGKPQNGLEEKPAEISLAETPNTSRPTTPVGPSHLVVASKAGPLGKISRRARKAQHSVSAPASSGDETSARKKAAKPVKKGRKWDADGLADEEDNVQLDYSVIDVPSNDSDAEALGRSTAMEQVDSSTWGSQSKGKFLLKDLDDEVHSILASAEAKNAASAAPRQDPSGGLIGSGLSTISSLFRNVVGGKTLTKEDLDKAMKGMEEHLLKKNVAREAAVRLCEGVEKELVGVKTGSFESTLARLCSPAAEKTTNDLPHM